jgi:hypothetical protein
MTKANRSHDQDLVVVRTFSNKFDADVAKTALDAAEIDSIVRADDAGGTRPGLWMGAGVELLVRAEDANRADEILRGSRE